MIIKITNEDAKKAVKAFLREKYSMELSEFNLFYGEVDYPDKEISVVIEKPKQKEYGWWK